MYWKDEAKKEEIEKHRYRLEEAYYDLVDLAVDGEEGEGDDEGEDDEEDDDEEEESESDLSGESAEEGLNLNNDSNDNLNNAFNQLVGHTSHFWMRSL